MMDWMSCVQTFVQVVEDESFAKAAEHLYTSASAVSKRIAWLEDKLGAQLLKRSTRHLQLTSTGSIFYARCKPLLSEWEDIRNELSALQKEPQGRLCVATTPAFGYQALSHLLPDFLQLYPKLELELKLINYGIDLRAERIDICIANEHFMRPEHHVQAYFLLNFFRQVYAAPRYLEQYGEPKSLTELTQHNCLINTLVGFGDVWQLGDKKIKVQGNYKANDSNALVNMALAGLGLIYVSSFSIPKYLASKALVPVLNQYRSPEFGLYAFTVTSRFTPLTTELFVTFLKSTLPKYFI